MENSTQADVVSAVAVDPACEKDVDQPRTVGAVTDRWTPAVMDRWTYAVTDKSTQVRNWGPDRWPVDRWFIKADSDDESEEDRDFSLKELSPERLRLLEYHMRPSTRDPEDDPNDDSDEESD